ncbi:MAG TPA: polyprenyl diphosphate synthase [Terriglobia bacterium]|nr:polyprenyl diphosphate synthase [Terriglobia bacterium]
MTHDPGEYPRQSRLSVAIIMDGSGRWAMARGLPRAEGHRAGRAAVGRTVLAALECGIRMLTLFTFSTDNWGRPEDEVAEMMRTFEGFFRVDAPALVARGVNVTVIGRRNRLPISLRQAIEKIEAANLVRGLLHVRFAIDYSGRDAILDAARRFRQIGDDSAESFARLFTEMDQSGEPVPDVDLLIRTGGEQRLSNCPLWEIAYAELYFTPCLWPDFGPAELDAALQEFYTRHRRFGRLPAMV